MQIDGVAGATFGGAGDRRARRVLRPRERDVESLGLIDNESIGLFFGLLAILVTLVLPKKKPAYDLR